MSKENILLVLWIIFGFIFITAIDSILHFITYLIYFIKSELGLSYKIMRFSIPIITLTLYSLTTILIFKRIKLKSNSNGIYLTEFPKKLFILFALIAFLLKPLAYKLSGLYAEHANSIENMDFTEFLQVNGLMNFGINFSRWLILIILIIIFLKKHKAIENEVL